MTELCVPYLVEPSERLASILACRIDSGTMAFRGLAASGNTYWIKVPNQPQGPRILATEQIVAAVGRLIDAPVRQTALIEITQDWSDYRVTDGLLLSPCVAHASLELGNAVESRDQSHMRADDNARRWARWVALWDWCLGGDEQWLYAHDSDKSMWSFDHNMWIHDAADWSAETCNGTAIMEWAWRGKWEDIDSQELVNVADRLDEVKRSALVEACYAIPQEWGVSQADLDSLVDMLFERKSGVAARLRVNAPRGRRT